MSYLLVIDQGTTSSRAIIFNSQGDIKSFTQQEVKQYFPQSGWVEQQPEQIWHSVLTTCHQALANSQLTIKQIAGIAITNQRETTLIWNKTTGQTIYPAIVWQDRRTQNYCQTLKQQGHEPLIQRKTGLVLDPYFSASKIVWLLANVPKAKQQALAGQLVFGTMDTYLLWRLTQCKVHKTDATNASRTLLFNIHQQRWDEELIKLFAIPASLLAEVEDNTADFGYSYPDFLGEAKPVVAMAGDQQAALIGQGCLQRGMSKSTFGTGCFVLQNTGSQPVQSNNRLLTTTAYRIQGNPCYGLEGSIFMAGATIQWLRDGLHLINQAQDSEQLARQTTDMQGVYLVPAFTGLGAPYWQANARGAILGLSCNSGIKEVVTAGLASVCYQVKDLIMAMAKDGAEVTHMRVDGGMVTNNWLLEFLAGLLNIQVDRPFITETTALGGAYLAALQLGLLPSLDRISQQWHVERTFMPSMNSTRRQQLYQGWLAAVKQVLTE
jgi:glycerol kinase